MTQCAAFVSPGVPCAVWHTRIVRVRFVVQASDRASEREVFLCATHRAALRRGALWVRH